MKNKRIIILIPFAFMFLVVGAVLSVRSETPLQGNDPVVSKSYVDEVFTKDIKKEAENILKNSGVLLGSQVDKYIEDTKEKYNSYLLSDDFIKRIVSSVSDEAQEILSHNTPFRAVKVAKGKIVIFDIGSELILRSGNAECYSASAPGLICETAGNTLENGKALIKNTLYIATLENRGIKANSECVVMIKGDYSLE